VQTIVHWVVGIHRFIWNIDFAKPRQNGFQQFVFVLYNNEKSSVVAKEFNTAAQSGLSVNSELVCIIQNNTFEQGCIIALHIGFCKMLEFVADKFDAFPMGAIHKHDVIFNAHSVASIDTIDKIANNGSFAATR
jgi:hypothetical protein